MKHLFLLCLLVCGLRAAGQVSPSATQMRTTVSAYLSKTLPNPVSYRPLTWGEPKPETKQSENIDKAADEMQAFVDGVHKGTCTSKQVDKMEAAGAPVATLIKINNQAKAQMEAAEAHHKRAEALMALTDTTVLGTGIMHTYRATNKAGKSVMTRAFFVVLNAGGVRVIKQELTPPK